MKKINFYFFAVMAGLLVFSSCERDEEKVITSNEVTITFESVELNADGYQNNFPNGLILSGVDFYNDFDETWSSWEGFAVSRLTDRVTPGFENQFSVYGTGGANGSTQFAVIFDGFNEVTHCQFLNGEEFTFRSLMINNTTWVVHSLRNGDGIARAFGDGDWFKIIITGFNAAGTETGKVEFYLADFRNGRTFICQEWTEVNLLGLGKVNRLEFTFESTDNDPLWGMNTPAFACIDNIVFVKN